jgi:hypothetical protein
MAGSRQVYLGFTERTRSAAASQVIGRLLIQTGRRLDALIDNDFDDLLAASTARHGAGKPSRHYSSATHTARQVMFHLGVFTEQPVNATSLCGRALRSGCGTPPRSCVARLWPTSIG